jgi:hypothetical protein
MTKKAIIFFAVISGLCLINTAHACYLSPNIDQICGSYTDSVGCYSNYFLEMTCFWTGSSCVVNPYYGMPTSQTPNVNCFSIGDTNCENGGNTPPYGTPCLTGEAPSPPTAGLIISAPATAAEITDNSTHLVGSYSDLDASSYGYGFLKIWLQNLNSLERSQQYEIQLTAISGTFDFPVSNFSITQNGNWNVAAEQNYLDNNGQELSIDLSPVPAYVLDFNVEGNSAPYAFTDWNNWYLTNAAGGYSTPSDFANSIEGFFQPIFTNVYGFANNTLPYFNAITAYNNGQSIGSVFPIAQAYLNNIDIFFGGFPLVPFFEFMVVIMMGIFIVRTIFKFIPFFG